MPPITLSTLGSCTFPVAAAHVWNSLPEAVISSSSQKTFRCHLKTHLFRFSYLHLIFDCQTSIVTVVLVVMFRCLGHSKNSCLLTYLLCGMLSHNNFKQAVFIMKQLKHVHASCV